MRLRLLEIIAPIQRIKPRLEKEPRPLPVPDHHTPRRDARLVLRNHQIHILRLQMTKSLDDAVGRHDRHVLLHDLLQPRGRHDVLLDLELRVHHQPARVQEPYVAGVGVLSQRVAHGDHGGPGEGRGLQVVVADLCEEGFVACVGRGVLVSMCVYVRGCECAAGLGEMMKRTVLLGVFYPVLPHHLQIRAAESAMVEHRYQDHGRGAPGHALRRRGIPAAAAPRPCGKI